MGQVVEVSHLRCSGTDSSLGMRKLHCLLLYNKQPPNKDAENNRFTVSHSSWRSQRRSVSGSGLAGWFRFGGLSQGCIHSVGQNGRYV